MLYTDVANSAIFTIFYVLIVPAISYFVFSKKIHWSENEQESILRHFIQGGDTSALGLAQAVTSVAQTVKSPDRQDELETSAIVAAELAIV